MAEVISPFENNFGKFASAGEEVGGPWGSARTRLSALRDPAGRSPPGRSAVGGRGEAAFGAQKKLKMDHQISLSIPGRRRRKRECQSKHSTTETVGTLSNPLRSWPAQQRSARRTSCAHKVRTRASTSPALAWGGKATATPAALLVWGATLLPSATSIPTR